VRYKTYMPDNLDRIDLPGDLRDEPPPPPPDSFLGRWIARIFATYVVLRWILVGATVAVAAVVASSLVGGVTGSTAWRLTLAVAASLLLPLLVRWRLRCMVERRLGRRPRLGGAWFLAGFNLLALVVLCLGFGDGTGTALRRRGDWFLGDVEGYLPRRYRRGMGAVARYLERFDLPPEAQRALDDAARPQPPIPPELPKFPTPVVAGMAPLPPLPVPTPAPREAVWFHPLAGPERELPPNAACRFGAPRPGHRPRECELGHCGVDLFQPFGSSVYAARDGVVAKLQRDARAGGIAGRFVWLEHKGGKVVTSYVHLDRIRADLKVGSRVRGGEAIGTLGLTGIKRSIPHLHFGLAVTRGPGRRRWVDPEPLLWFWHLPRPGEAPATHDTRPVVATGVTTPRPDTPPVRPPPPPPVNDRPIWH
jgi:murein DD-endopeptidase MepM/ murein hydrolase activator NlpD